MKAGRSRLSLRSSLVLGNLLLVTVALAVTSAVTAFVGPPLFYDYIARGAQLPEAVRRRAEEAFQLANLVEYLLATAAALAFSLALSAVITLPVRRTAREIDAAARRFDAGDYAARLPERSSVREMATLAATVNRMAETIQHTEATRSRLLADLSHEMRTPLAAVDGFLEAIEDGVETADPPTIALLRQQVRKLTRLASDVRAVSSADEGRLAVHLRPTRADEVLREACAALQPAFAAKGVAVALQPWPPVMVSADPHRLGQVVTNLLSNALRHTSPGGTVTLSLSATAASVQIVVEDDGEGIAAEHLPHVFERFYRGHPQAGGPDQGSGIGLTISRAIVTAHAGTIHLESAGSGRGATARITLPAGAG